MAQPDYERLSNGLIQAANECILLPNIPALRGAQGLVDLINELREEIRQVSTKMIEQTTVLHNDISTLHVDITTRMDSSEANVIARLQNSTINNPQTPFHPLRDRRNMLVDGFPDNGRTLSNFTPAELTTVLRAFNLPVHGNRDERKKRLGEYIGVVVGHVF